MNKKLVIGIIGGIIILSLLITLAADPVKVKTAKSGDRIGVIFVEGLITGARNESGMFSSVAEGHSLLEQLKEAREDDGIKAVLIRINSPGGSAAASQEIGDEIEKIRRKGKVVVASMGDVAASGGYWIAAKADKIIANPATVTGSIGVIMETMNMQELFNKIGISPQTIKSGRYKDIGSSSRPLTPEERELLQTMVNDIYNQFVDTVAEGRKMDRKTVLQLADGRIYTGKQAKELGLVDKLGNYYDAVALTGELAKIKGEPVLHEFGPKNPFERLFWKINSILRLNNYFHGLTPQGVQTFQEMLKSQPALPNR